MKKILFWVILILIVFLIFIGSFLLYQKINEGITGSAVGNQTENKEGEIEGDYAIITIIEDNESSGG